MNVRVKQEVFRDEADGIISIDNGNGVIFQIKQENELIISEQAQEHQSCPTHLIKDEQQNQTHDLDCKCDDYACKLLDHEEGDVYKSRPRTESHNKIIALQCCPVCGEVFTQLDHFRDSRHKEFMEKSNIMCHLCNHPSFSQETHLYEHLIEIHHLCKKDWESDHFRAIDDDGVMFECLKCHTICRVTDTHCLLKHHLQHEDNRCWYCKFCFAKCKIDEPMHLCRNMYQHFQPHSGKQKSKPSGTHDLQIEHSWPELEDSILHCCPYCNEEYQTFQEWQVHMRDQHFSNTLQGLKMSLVEKDNRALRCLECETLIATSLVKLHSHCFQHLPYKPYKCRRCLIHLEGYQIALEHCLKECEENHNPVYFKSNQMFKDNPVNLNSIIILCVFCKGKQFTSAETVEAHFRTHHNNFKEHFEKDTKLQKMVCKVCRNSLNTISSSTCLQHYLEHLGNTFGPYKCLFCRRTFVTYEGCRIHVNRCKNIHKGFQNKCEEKGKKIVDNRKSSSICAVETCLRSYRNSSDIFPVRLFKFPKDEFFRNIWIRNLNLHPGDKCKYVCDRHFERKYFGRKFLMSNAIPTLNLTANSLLESAVCLQPEDRDEISENPMTITPHNLIAEPKAQTAKISDALPKHFPKFSISLESSEKANINNNLPPKKSQKSEKWKNVNNFKDNISLDNVTPICSNCLNRTENDSSFRRKYSEMSKKLKHLQKVNILLKNKIKSIKSYKKLQRQKYLLRKTRSKKPQTSLSE